MCNFGRRYHEEQSCEIILNLKAVQEEMSIKDISNWSSGGPLVQQSGTICAILVDGIMRNNSVKLF